MIYHLVTMQTPNAVFQLFYALFNALKLAFKLFS